MRFEMLPNKNVYGTFEVFNDDNDIILGGAEYFKITSDDAFLQPSDWGSEFYTKLQTIYRLFDMDLANDILEIIKKLKNGEFVEEKKKLN